MLKLEVFSGLLYTEYDLIYIALSQNIVKANIV